MALTTVSSSGAPTTRAQVEAALRGERTDVRGRIFEIVLLSSLFVSLLILAVLVFRILGDGASVYTDRGVEFLEGRLSSDETRAGISQGLIGSPWIALGVIVISLPLGIAAAIYLEEYAPRNRLTRFIELNIRNLAGVPSVVYGLLGLAIFVNALNGFSSNEGASRATLAAAAVTLAVLVLPVVIITTAEAIRAVPSALREGAYGVGATRWEVIRTQVLPYAAPGILTGALLSIARAVGEAAPLIVVGAVTGLLGGSGGLAPGDVFNPDNLFHRFTAMPVVVTTWAKQPEELFKINNAAAAIIAMMVFIVVINSIAIVLRNRFERKRSE
jgi:phosphate transport system permease protein